MANRRFTTRTHKRATSWFGNSIDISNLVVGTPQLLTMITEGQLENFPTPTIIRVRGTIGVLTDDSSTPSSFGTVTMGLILVTQAASTAGAVPVPILDTASDWLWYDTAVIGFAAADVIGDAVTIDRRVVDSKAMRKVGND